MEKNNIKTIIQLFMTFMNERDLDKLTGLFSENIDWDIPGNTDLAPWLGKRTTKNEVRDFYELLWKNTEPISARMNKMLTEDNYGVIIGEFETNMLSTNKIVHSFFCIQITLQNNLIIKYRLFEDSYAVAKALTTG